MRSRARGWIMPVEDIAPMLQMIEEKIASSEIEVEHRHALIRLRDILEDDLQASADQSPAHAVDREPLPLRFGSTLRVLLSKLSRSRLPQNA